MHAEARGRSWLGRLFPQRRVREKMITALREQMARDQKDIVRELREIRRVAEQNKERADRAQRLLETRHAQIVE